MTLYELELFFFPDLGDEPERVLYYQISETEKLNETIVMLLSGTFPPSKIEIKITVHESTTR